MLINTREGNGPRIFSNVLQSPTGSVGNSSRSSNVRLRDFGQWTTELSSVRSTWNFEAIGRFRANLRWFSLSGSARRVG